jgi:CheY-like chemotaxis protein
MSDTTSSPVPRNPFRVLIADDGRNAAEILALFFKWEGMETSIAFDGIQAVEQALTFKPDLVCLDLQMPNMDGYEAARLIRDQQENVVLVALSGWDGSDERQRTKLAGFDLHLVKPVTPDVLRQVISDYLC